MAYSNNSKYRMYQSLNAEERLALAIATGAKTGRALTIADSTLANILRRFKEMKSFIFATSKIGSRDYYASMVADELIELAVDIGQREKISSLNEFGAFDFSLHQVLCKRALIGLVAQRLKFSIEDQDVAKNYKACVEKKSRYDQYREMSDDHLIDLVKAMKITSSNAMLKRDSVLHTTFTDRYWLRSRLTELGFRREKRDWDSMTFENWLSLCGDFPSLGDFHYSYTKAYGKALSSGFWVQIIEAMGLNGKWKGVFGFDGRRYDSRAEAIVANWLFISDIEYIAHPLLPWSKSRRRQAADLQLVATGEIVEIFLCSEIGSQLRSDNPSWIVSYIEKRKFKEEKCSATGTTMIAIEAEIHRYSSLSLYLAHIQESFSRHGINLRDPGTLRLDLGGDCRGMDWSLDDFIDYANKNSIVSLNGFTSKGHTDLYNILIHRQLRDDVRYILDKKYGRKTVAMGKFLMSPTDLKIVCSGLNISTKPGYELAYKTGQLPMGAPSSIRQSYGVKWHEFFHGRGWAEFWPFEKAREYVRSRKFTSPTKFIVAVRNDFEMRYIRRNPNNRTSGGYPEFIDWFDFLGKDA